MGLERSGWWLDSMIPKMFSNPDDPTESQNTRVGRDPPGPSRPTAGTPKDHPQKKKQSRCLTALSKQFLNSGSLPWSCDLPQGALPALGTSRSTHGAAQGATQPHASSSRPHKSLGWGGNRGGAGLPASAARFPRCPGAAQPPPPGLGCKAGGRGEGTRRSGQGSARGCSALRRRSRSSATGTGERGGQRRPCPLGVPRAWAAPRPQHPSAPSVGRGAQSGPAFAPKRRQGEQSPLRQAARTQPLSSQLVSGQIAGLGPGLGSTKQK